MKLNKAIMLLILTTALAGCSVEDLPEDLTAPIPQVPPPSNLNALLGAGQVTLSWTAPGGFTYSGFVVYRNEVGAAPTRLATAASSPYVDSTVRPGVTYEYSVAGVNNDGLEGSASTALLVRSTVFSAAINGGADYTNTRSVLLNLGAPAATQLVRVSEDPGFAGAQWVTFFTPVPFQLSAGDGMKTVYFQFTDEFGHATTSISDNITLDTETAIQAAGFSPTTAAPPGALLHFTITPVGTELDGNGEFLVQGLASPIVALDDGTGGDNTPRDGIYETDFVVPQSLRGVNLGVVAFFNDAAGNRSDQFDLANNLSISDPPQQAVTLLPSQGATVGSISLRWSQATGANFNRYELYRDTSPGVTTSALRVTAITDVAITVFQDAGLDEGETYYYKVFVANDLNEFIGSNEIMAQTVDDPPTAVVLDPVGSVTQTSLSLTWSQSANTDFASYEVYRATQPGVTNLTGTLITNPAITDRFTNFFDDSGLNTTLNTYYYRVYVVDKAGLRTRSNEVSAVDVQTSIQTASFSPTNAAAPGATVHFSVTPGGNELGGSAQITIANFGGNIVALDTGTSGDPTPGDGIYEVNFVVPPSLRGTNLTVSAIFTDAAGNQSSAFEMPNLLSITDPPAPVTLFAPLTITTSSLGLRWSQTSDANFARYEVYRDTAPGVSNATSPRIANVIDPAVTQFNDTGLNEAMTYHYKVYVVNDLQEGTASNEIAPQTTDEPPIAVVLDPPSSVTQTSVTLTWSQNANTDFGSYKIYRDTKPGVTNQGAELITIGDRFMTYYDDTTVNTSQNSYYYRIYVVDQSLKTARSNEVSVQNTQPIIETASFSPTNPVGPGAPMHFIVKPSGNRLGGSAAITIEGYAGTITALDDGTGGDPTAGNGVYEVNFSIPPSLRGRELAVTAVFTDAAGTQSPPFEFASVLTITDLPDAVTLYPSQDSTTTTISLLWTQSPETYFARYEVYRGTSTTVSRANSPRVANITDRFTNFFTDNGLNEAQTYYYRVYVGNDLDEFSQSNVRMARTADVPPTPVVLDPVSSVTASGLTLSWSRNDDTDFKEYRVYRNTSPGVTDQLAWQQAVITDRYQTFFDDTLLNTVSNTYYYRVYVIDKSGKRARSNEVSSAVP